MGEQKLLTCKMPNVPMRNPSHKLIKSTACALFWLLISATSVASAAPLFMQSWLGFNGRFQLNKWTPLTIVLENRGRPVNGKLEVMVTSGNEYRQDVHQAIYSTPVELPYNSKKRYAFTVLIKSFTHELIIRVKQAEDTVLSESLSLRSHYTTKGLALVSGHTISPDLLAQLPQTLNPVHVHPRFLPETWYGYDAVKILILNTEMLGTLRNRQYEALVQWVNLGGYLVTGSGLNYGNLHEARIRRFLPVKVLAHKPFLEFKSFQDFCGGRLVSPEPFLVLNVEIENAQVLLKENDTPIITQRPLGMGKILFLSFDFESPPFSRWDKNRLFWSKILSLHPLWAAAGVDLANQKILESMFSALPARFPKLRIILLFLAGYGLFLKLIINRISKHTQNRWKYGRYLLIGAIIFSIASYCLFFYPANPALLTYSSFSQMNISAANMKGVAKSVIGIFSTRATDYRFSLGSLFYPLTHLLYQNSKQKIPHKYEMRSGPDGQQVAGLNPKWSHSCYTVNAPFEFSVSAQASLNEKQLQLNIENNTPHPFYDCGSYYNERFFFLGNYPAAGRQIRKIPRSQLAQKEILEYRKAKQMSDRRALNSPPSYLAAMQKGIVPELLMTIHSTYQLRPKTIVFMGWIKTGLLQPDFNDPEIQGRDLTLMIWEIPLKRRT